MIYVTQIPRISRRLHRIKLAARRLCRVFAHRMASTSVASALCEIREICVKIKYLREYYAEIQKITHICIIISIPCFITNELFAAAQRPP